jgi:hypothetical protein
MRVPPVPIGASAVIERPVIQAPIGSLASAALVAAVSAAGENLARDESGRTVRRYDDAPPHKRMQGEVLSCCGYAGTGFERISAVRRAASWCGSCAVNSSHPPAPPCARR